jgi:CSLREA domain-containing protein
MVLPLALAQAASAFRVNTIADGPDKNPGDGKCATAYKECTLRAAVEESNALAGANKVTVPRGSYTLARGELQISSKLTIAGAGTRRTALRGGGAALGGVPMRVLQVGYPNGDATISDVTIKGGQAVASGGGIQSSGDLTLVRSSVRGNTVTPLGNNISSGGGIAAGGSTTIVRSTISGNSVASNDNKAFGGGIDNTGSLTIVNSTISGNSAKSDVGSQGVGGAIANIDSHATLRSSTVARNAADGSGGNLYGTDIAITSTTTFRNTLIAGGTASSGPNCAGFGIFVSNGYNLENANTCALNKATDRPSATAKIGQLANNGGPTDTIALLAGSKAIDHGPPSCPPPATDQRGVPRPQHGGCDIGAFEAQ